MASMTVPDGAGLRWTGHALVDVGIAGVCAFSGRLRPEEVTLGDLDRVSDFIVDTYYQKKLGTYLTCVFMNASFTQPNEGEAKTQAFIRQYCHAHRADPDPRVAGRRCVFSGLPATSPLVRTHLPLFSAENILNFRPQGETFVPAAGVIVVALLFLPMASVRSEGRLLAVHADDPALTLAFARRYVENNRKLIALALPRERRLVYEEYDREIPSWDPQKKRYKYADAKGPRSLVVADLTAIATEAGPSEVQPRPMGLTAYLLSNSGQGPSLEIFQVPSGAVTFVRRAAGATTRSAWNAIAARFRPVRDADRGQDDARARAAGRKRQRKSKEEVPGRPGWSKNPAFEELCAIFEAGFTDRSKGGRWLRRYILARMRETVADPGRTDAVAQSWNLTDLFVGEVLGMTKGRIDSVRTFADKLADWISRRNDRKLLHALTFNKPWELRGVLLRAQRESARASELLFGLEEFSTVWLSQEGDEYLVRDLVCLRVTERLYQGGYFTAHADAIQEIASAGVGEREEGPEA